VTLTAVASNGWTFMQWQGSVTATNNPLVLAMNSSQSVQAIFGTPITTNAPSGGAIVVAPNQALYPYGSTVRLIGAPGNGKDFSRWFSPFSGPTNNPLDFVVVTNNPS